MSEFTISELQALAAGDFEKVPGATIPTAGDRFIVRLLGQMLLELKRGGKK